MDRLFRAWDKVTNRWYDPKRIHIDGNGHVHWEPLYDKPMILKPDSVDVQWSTGLKVHNKILYGGDIFTTPDYPFYSDNELNYVGVVVYEDHKDYLGWYYEMYVVSDRVRGAAIGSSLVDVAHADMKIIGNIHQHKHLIEDKDQS